MSHSKICEFDTRLTVLLDNVPSNIGLALFSLDDDAIVATTCNHVLPYFRCTQLRSLRTRDLYAVLVAPFDLVLHQDGRIVVDLDTDLVQVELVASDLKTMRW